MNHMFGGLGLINLEHQKQHLGLETTSKFIPMESKKLLRKISISPPLKHLRISVLSSVPYFRNDELLEQFRSKSWILNCRCNSTSSMKLLMLLWSVLETVKHVAWWNILLGPHGRNMWGYIKTLRQDVVRLGALGGFNMKKLQRFVGHDGSMNLLARHFLHIGKSTVWRCSSYWSIENGDFPMSC